MMLVITAISSMKGIQIYIHIYYLTVHGYTDNEGWGSNAIEILGTQLEVGSFLI